MSQRSLNLSRRRFAQMAGATPLAAALGTPLALS